MTSKAHNEEATARDAEVRALHPSATPKHVRTTLSARVVLRAVEREDNEKRLPIVGDSYVTAVVENGVVEFYAESGPVWHAASIPVSRITGISTAQNFDYTPPSINPTIRISIAEQGTEPLDIDLEIFSFDGGELHQLTDIEPEVAWWKQATGH